ncbi:hypothetical protein HWV62_30169 [Athelia sp. TMB]|nr:hypothetical protein HWV62_30169 [Athelia sp. TMB]
MGTFWYHSHLSTQYCDGLRGPFVVYDPEDPHQDLYDVDDESTVITLADCLVTVPYNSDSTLINGLGRYASGPKSPLSVINVNRGTRYRFRLVSMSCDTPYNFTIDGHTMTIIEVDGVNTEPLVVDAIQIFAGQRYSFVLEANQTVDNYWIRAEPKDASLGDGAPNGFAGGINSAILRYASAAIEEPTSVQTPSTNPLLETNLHPLENPGAPGEPNIDGADVSLTLNLGVNAEGTRLLINNVSFVPPSIPVLLQILSGSTKATDLLPKGSVYTLPPNQVIQLSIPGGIVGSPHTFDVIRSAGSSVYNYENPVRRDVVSTGYTGDNVTVRFVTDNTGPWFLHCGMAVVFAEDAEGTAVDDPVTDDWKALCPKQYIAHLTPIPDQRKPMAERNSPVYPPLDNTIVLSHLIDFHMDNNAILPAFVYSEVPGSLTEVSFLEFGRAAHRAASIIRPGRSGPENEVIALIANVDTLLYHTLLVGTMRAGAVPFVMAPRNTAEALVSLLVKSGCHRVLTTMASLGTLINRVKELLPSDFSLSVADAPTMMQCYPQSHPVVPALAFTPYPHSDTPKPEDIIMYMHSSGSTGLPKVIPHTSRALLGWTTVPNKYGDEPDAVNEWRTIGRPGVMHLPPFHSLAFVLQLLVPLANASSVALYPPMAYSDHAKPPVIPTPENIKEHCQRTNVTATVVIPSFLETWCHEVESVQWLKTLDFVIFGGGPLSPLVGESLARQGVNIIAMYGGTEFGPVTALLPGRQERSPEDWSYMRFSSALNDTEAYKVSVHNLPDVDGYACSDCWELHPKIAGFWRLMGRLDDVIILGSGENVVPVPMETIIMSSSLIGGAVMFGRARSQVGLLIEPAHGVPIHNLAEFLKQTWPIIEEANKVAPGFGRIFKDMIIVTGASKPMLRVGKGTVARKATLEFYGPEIEAFVGATFLRNRILRALQNSPDVYMHKAAGGMKKNIVYLHPDVKSLAAHVAGLVSGRENNTQSKSAIHAIEAMVQKYSSDFYQVQPSSFQSPPPSGAVVLLTGSTGGLGSFLLEALLSDEQIRTVYAYNRPSSGAQPIAQRQMSAFADKGFDVRLLESPKLVYVEGDAASSNIGLAKDLYDQIHSSISIVIHNAWRVDFNLSLASFESNVQGTRNLIDFASTAKHASTLRFLFTSSIGSAQGWDNARGAYPEEVQFDASTAIGSGYGESKYVAERTCSFRIGQIAGDLPRGAWNKSDWVPVVVKSSIAIGALPACQGMISWLPARTVTRAILDVAYAAEVPAETLNLVHPRPSSWPEMFKLFNDALVRSRTIPSPLSLIPFSEWFEKIEQCARGADKAEMTNIPALRMLEFFRGMAIADGIVRQSGRTDVEAGGLASLSILKSQAASRSLREAGLLDSLFTAQYFARTNMHLLSPVGGSLFLAHVKSEMLNPSPVYPPLDGSLSYGSLVDFHAAHNPTLPIFVYSEIPGTVIEISFLEFGRAAHRVARILRGNEGEVVALIANVDNLLYQTLFAGMMRAGLVPFPISPRNSHEAIISLLQKTSCTRILTTTSSLGDLISQITASTSCKVEEAPTISQCYPSLGHEMASDGFAPYPELERELDLDRTIFYLHSSGSTGLPKAIPQTGRITFSWASMNCLMSFRNLKRMGGAHLLPFHTLGLHMQLLTPLSHCTSVALYPPTSLVDHHTPLTMPTCQNAMEHAQRCGVTGLVAVPSFVEDWVQGSAADECVEWMRTLQFVGFTGGPLAVKVGDSLARAGVNIAPLYGGTEFGCPTVLELSPLQESGISEGSAVGPSEWAYVRFSKGVNTRWVPQGDDMFELQFLKTSVHTVSVGNLPDVEGYATKDLFTPHPTKPGLWKIVGRLDDVIILASGYNVVPAPLETIIMSSPLVKGAVIFGRGRKQVGVLIEPAITVVDSTEFRNSLWPIVEEANRSAPTTVARILKEMILVTKESKPLPRVAKGTVAKQAAFKLYADEIDAL